MDLNVRQIMKIKTVIRHYICEKSISKIEAGWNIISSYYQKKKFAYYTENIGSESVSGLFLIQKNDYSYAFSYGQTHFIVRKYCDKDFGLNLAERIIEPQGLKMKHFQTFTSDGKKDIALKLEHWKAMELAMSRKKYWRMSIVLAQ